ncbi:hypothetical protein [Microbacterium dauci]|uniref:Uncharacterized protein n=1 Tax=Microbacterium dauci TaxID=3048008 RepID=A0ABT6ZCB8_9MICO|nr:hypothetical protein [Microbacterium sp. LX3-4]MDJ1113789.1 hypothetical protein [Microbacterium sp. LX3-4]
MNSDEGEISRFIELLSLRDEQHQHALAYFHLLRSRRALKSVSRFVARCQNGCLLLTIFETPSGPAFHQPRYKLSDSLNEIESNAAGRAANTEDGDRRWREQAGMVSAAINFVLTCDHTRRTLEFADIELGSPGSPTRRVV